MRRFLQPYCTANTTHQGFGVEIWILRQRRGEYVTTSATPPELTTQRETGRPDRPGESGPRLPRHENSKKRALLWLAFLIVIAAVAGYAVWRATKPAPPPTNAGFGRGRGGFGRGGGNLGPTPVVVANAARASVPVYLNGLGNVIAFYTVTVSSRVDGQIMKVDFNEGDFVKAGQVLVEIDPRPYEVQLEQAQGALAHDQAVLNEARIDLDRYKTAFARNAIAKQQLDDQEQLVAQDEGVVKQDTANVDNAKLQLVYAKVTAPISGVLGLREVDPGNMVHGANATPLVVITQLQPIAVDFTIPEDSLPQVTQKLRAGAHLPADAYNRDNSKKLASGTLLTVDNQIDNTTGTSKLKAVFDNKDGALFPQQFVNIRLLVDTLKDQLVVPAVAVQNGQQGNFVYVVDQNSRVHLKTVQVGVTTDTVADILGGLSDGDRVVTDGADRLVENAVVRVRQPGDLNNPSGDGSGRGRRGGGRGRGQAGNPANSDNHAGTGSASGSGQGNAPAAAGNPTDSSAEEQGRGHRRDGGASQ